ncbi:MAG: hypothetical protein L6R38_001185 [Xanthoria sp. 2 TBL-2021]|nr:MAG: hypothetical protein L6R38_001185 [Xanthoria sp. 2 TBL-2021]
MGCHGEREKLEDARAEQKWGYINLGDFKSTSCYSTLSYIILYIFIFISVAVYAVDLFTAANLLFFNRWSGQVKPVISFKVARWLFAACILLSLVLLVYRWIRALRVIRSGVVAASYLDPLAVRIQSIRPGARGRGYRRFLVFGALTEGRKGAEYIALFTYFSFEAWMRIIFAQGPRQLLNAQTLYSVMQADLLPADQHAAKDGRSNMSQFWTNVGILANHNREQAAILFGMLFTLIIWLISVISLLFACIFYLTFLWRHIPTSDGTLSRYCRRKVDTRLSKIVSKKVDKALARGERLRAQEGAKAFNGERPAHVKRQPTLPLADEDHPSLNQAHLSRQTTQTTFSSGPSRHQSGRTNPDRQPMIPIVSPLSDRPEAPSRSTTQSSYRPNQSYGSDVPLVAAAEAMGYAPPVRSFSRPTPLRSVSDRPTPYEHPSAMRNPSAASRSTQQSYNATYSARPPPGRMTSNSTSRNLTRQNTDTSTHNPAMPFQHHSSMNSRPPTRQGRQTPALIIPYTNTPAIQEIEMHTQPPPSSSSNGQQYVAYNPNIHNASTSSSARNFSSPTRPPPPMHDYFPPQPSPVERPGTAPPVRRPGTAPLPPLLQQRSGTAPIPQYDASSYQHHVQDASRAPIPGRSATAAPERQWQRKPVQHHQQQPHY